MIVSVSPGCSRVITVVRPMSSVASEVTLSFAGPSTSWSIAAATRRPGLAGLVDQPRAVVVRAVLLDSSGSVSAASTRGSASARAGSCSLATSSDCTTSSAGPVEDLDLVADRGDRPLGE